MKNVITLGIMLTLASLAVTATAGDVDGVTTPPRPVIEVSPTETIVTFDGTGQHDGDRPDLGAIIALPEDATWAEAILVGGEAAGATIEGDLMRLRGTPMALVRVVDPGIGMIRVAVRHDGSWASKANARLASAGLHGGLPGRVVAADKAALPATGGSYVIITVPEFESAIAPLAEWKMRKGWPVVTVNTNTTGGTNENIRDWLVNAYQTWDLPPEYILLVGDVEDIPNWLKEETVSDFPYTLLDGDDWLPDAMVGRFSVATASEVATVVAKTINYERDPDMSQTDWFTRAVAVAGQSQSTTPKHTVLYCNEQLETIGFDEATPANYFTSEYGNYIVSPFQTQDGYGAPPDGGRDYFMHEVNQGCSMVVYRGWAYSTIGWAPPNFWTEHISALTNGAKLPVVFSFVCLNNDFTADRCFGEGWIREGSPEAPRGAVAFVGNGEHHSHTRFNDAMAISVFDRIVDPEITTLGGALVAGKLRFMEHYPGELEPLPEFADEDDFAELCVEYYFYIYNLLGDPELNFHKALPVIMTVDHAGSLPVGATDLSVTVTDAAGTTLLAGARIGVVQNGELLGAALTDAFGSARVTFGGNRAVAGAVSLTVTRSGNLAYEADVTVGQAAAYLGVAGVTAMDTGENGINPADAIDLDLVIRNSGSTGTTDASLVLTIDGPATVVQGNATVPAIAGGADATIADVLSIALDDDAVDGAVVTGIVSITRGGDVDVSSFELVCEAPDLTLTAAFDPADGVVSLGETTSLSITLENPGTSGTSGGDLALDIVGPTGAVLHTTSIPFGALAAGGSEVLHPVDLQLSNDLIDGSSVTLLATAVTTEGYRQETSVPVIIGRSDAGAPAGPDAHGYYAYDSGDYLYPAQRPVYQWQEISTALGGSGEKLDFFADNLVTDMVVDLGFTFQYYGQNFTRIRVSDNGWLSFEADNEFFSFYNWPLPSTHGNGAVVAPFWDNLTPEPGGDSGIDSDGVYVYHDVSNHQYIIEWSRLNFIYSENPAVHTFQAVLKDPAFHATPTGDGEILFIYKQVADVDYMRMYASVGMESPDETDGLQLTYDGIRLAGVLPLGPGQAVRITTDPPVRVPLTVTGLTATPSGDRVHVTWGLQDDRPIVGWRIHAYGRDGLEPVTPDVLPAHARDASVISDLGDELVLEAILPHGVTVTSGVVTVGSTVTSLALSEPRPNPMHGETSIAFAMPRGGHVRLAVYDVRGRVVRTLIDGQADAGESLLVWRGRDDQGRNLADGVYFYRLEHAGQTLTRKLLLVR